MKNKTDKVIPIKHETSRINQVDPKTASRNTGFKRAQTKTQDHFKDDKNPVKKNFGFRDSASGKKSVASNTSKIGRGSTFSSKGSPTNKGSKTKGLQSRRAVVLEEEEIKLDNPFLE